MLHEIMSLRENPLSFYSLDCLPPPPTETKPPLTGSLLCWFPAVFFVVPNSCKDWITVQYTKRSLFSVLCEACYQVLKVIFRSSLP